MDSYMTRRDEAWIVFARKFGASIGDSSDASAWLGIWLGIAVVLTVFSGVAAVAAVVQAKHNELMRAMLTRSSA